ncbi:Cytokinesis protein sepH [Leucoagaricus sp. SymC.cos]|nr:Cytokinesis protein sepH [Leucoagaricus sp. SymC.cos]
MDSQSLPHETPTVSQATGDSDALAPVQVLVSQIDSESRAQEVADRAKDLSREETQLLVDLLSMTLERSSTVARSHALAWSSLVKTASSANVFSRHRTLKSENISSSAEASHDIYTVKGETPCQVRVLRRNKKESPSRYGDQLVSWAHLSHPNILPLYAAFLEGEDHPCLVSPNLPDVNICGHSRGLSGKQRLSLVLDVANGLCYMHQRNIVHGRLTPEVVLISSEGRALITALDLMSEAQELDGIPVRYSAPEILEDDDDPRPTKATDVWSFACLGYETLSGKVPFFQLSKDSRVSIAIGRGDKPLRPGQEGDGDGIITEVWRLLLACWEYRAQDRTDLLRVKEVLSNVSHQDNRPVPKPMLASDALNGYTEDTGRAEAILIQVLGTEQPSTLRVPEHLRGSLFTLAGESHDSDAPKRSANMAAAKKLSPQETQVLVDLLDLLSGIRYDPTVTIAECPYAKTYKARGLNVCVNVLTDLGNSSANVSKWASDWANVSHPNILPFGGVFHEGLDDSSRIWVITPMLDNGKIRDYAPTLPQKSRIPLLYDVISGLIYIHNDLDSLVGGLHGNVALTSNPPKALTRKVPYYQYPDDHEVVTRNTQFELPRRPEQADDEIDEIDDKAWDLILKCCAINPDDQPGLSQIQEMVADLGVEDNRPAAKPLFGPDVLALRPRPDIDFQHAESILNKIQVELLKSPLLKLVENRTKGVAEAVTELERGDIRSIVDFLDQTLKDHLSISEERNRVLALLSRITSATHIFPKRYELNGVRYTSQPFAEGGFGSVHQGVDTSMCVKVMKRLEPGALIPWVRELILWAHSSHPNVLPFYGVFLEGPLDSPQTCLVSPFMKNGNLQAYARRLPQKSRLPLISDVVNGLHYLHELGVVHGDLKGQNILISDEGRGLITDFGAAHITTATAASGSLSATTLRFSAPEMILGSKKPSKEFDIWSVGCLFYEILSRKAPYYEYKLEVQIIAALSRKEPPTRPGTANTDKEEKDDWDDDFDQDWDTIDDHAWSLIMRCCAPEPEDRPNISIVREQVRDLKIWDDRPEAKSIPGAEILKLRSPVMKVDLDRVEELVAQVQVSWHPLFSVMYPNPSLIPQRKMDARKESVSPAEQVSSP